MENASNCNWNPSLVGLVEYSYRFIKWFSTIAPPSLNLLEKEWANGPKNKFLRVEEKAHNCPNIDYFFRDWGVYGV